MQQLVLEQILQNFVRASMPTNINIKLVTKVKKKKKKRKKKHSKASESRRILRGT